MKALGRIVPLLAILGLAYYEFGSPPQPQLCQLNPIRGTEVAELVWWPTVRNPGAVLILCPGWNGNGNAMIMDKQWQAFAQRENLGLVGIHFESNDDDFDARRSYQFPAQGSGELLRDGIRKIYGENKPLFLFGMSAGAQFAARYVDWRPDDVVAWCEQSAGYWNDPARVTNRPPGIMACGLLDNDDPPRYRLGRRQFELRRQDGWPVIWLGIADWGHAESPLIDDFARRYFASVRANSHDKSCWIDLETNREISAAEAASRPATTGWIPDHRLIPGLASFRLQQSQGRQLSQ